MQISGWGRYPVVESDVVTPLTRSQLRARLSPAFSGIARGLGRSYGDSALAPQVISLLALDCFQAFDAVTGNLHCAAGVRLSEIVRFFLPRGWFLPVTPGTKFVTVGGAIASDVHGKNHHVAGCFSEYVRRLELMLPGGDVITCSKDENPALFRATCGGMGLTGVIVSAVMALKKVTSAYIEQTVVRAANLEEATRSLRQHADSEYTVAWIDCLARRSALGRSLVMTGAHAADNDLSLQPSKAIAVPLDAPGFLLNRYSVSLFNALYYQKPRKKHRRLYYDAFFYPLDAIGRWNRLYGKNGFVQYQCVLPYDSSAAALRCMLEKISASGKGSFLAVLKLFGAANENYLSFPMQGYTLALDFKWDVGVKSLLRELDSMLCDHGGRLYLTKDACMSEATFKRGYPHWERFSALRAQHGMDKAFRSMQAARLGL